MYSQTSTSHQYSLSHPDASPTAADPRDIYTCTTGTSTGAAFTTFTVALPTDIYSDTWTSSTADPQPGSIANRSATAPHATAAAAGNSTTSDNTTVAAAHATTAASSTNYPKFTAAANKHHSSKPHTAPLLHSSRPCRHHLQLHRLEGKAAHHLPGHQPDPPSHHQQIHLQLTASTSATFQTRHKMSALVP